MFAVVQPPRIDAHVIFMLADVPAFGSRPERVAAFWLGNVERGLESLSRDPHPDFDQQEGAHHAKSRTQEIAKILHREKALLLNHARTTTGNPPVITRTILRMRSSESTAETIAGSTRSALAPSISPSVLRGHMLLRRGPVDASWRKGHMLQRWLQER